MLHLISFLEDPAHKHPLASRNFLGGSGNLQGRPRLNRGHTARRVAINQFPAIVAAVVGTLGSPLLLPWARLARKAATQQAAALAGS